MESYSEIGWGAEAFFHLTTEPVDRWEERSGIACHWDWLALVQALADRSRGIYPSGPGKVGLVLAAPDRKKAARLALSRSVQMRNLERA